MNFENLQNIHYSYDGSSGMNCYTLAQHVRSLYHAPPLPDFSLSLAQYPTEASLPPDYILDALRQHCAERSGSAQHLDLLALRFRGVIALGTVIVHEGDRYVVFMRLGRDGSGQSGVESIDRMGRAIESVWVF